VLSGDETNWSRRYKANLEKLGSGDLVQVVQVVRDLAERDASRGLSVGERRMLARARLILLQEADALRIVRCLRLAGPPGVQPEAMR
jgi:RNA polymerase-interacting CarD/CdnL/TRCF family regulator